MVIRHQCHHSNNSNRFPDRKAHIPDSQTERLTFQIPRQKGSHSRFPDRKAHIPDSTDRKAHIPDSQTERLTFQILQTVRLTFHIATDKYINRQENAKHHGMFKI
ncbi:hypothetical protein BsWGS_04998 [Bradybaena similaris]